MSEKIEQVTLFGEETTTGPVTCLGLAFNNDDERREYFREELRKKLPELKKLEGFPQGADEDIIAISDPPYYTACPNPWIVDMIETWQKESRYDTKEYNVEPFVADVSEGKQNPIYNAHSYHTKVPHKAIMRYILHYTNPGDIILDGFSGTGMTGVASQFCGDFLEVNDLGYEVLDDGSVLNNGEKFSELGARKTILNDLSPAGTFISYNYNYPYNNHEKLQKDASSILENVTNEYEWMYQTDHVIDGKIQRDIHKNIKKGNILYTVFSDVFVCPNCSNELIFWDAAVDHEKGLINDDFNCPTCKAKVTKRNLEKAWDTFFDQVTSEVTKVVKKVPVLITYEFNGKRFTKTPDENDKTLIEKINNNKIENWFPINEIQKGDKTIEALRLGMTHTHHYYTQRNLAILAAIFKLSSNNQLKFLLTGMLTRSSKQARFLAKNYFHGGGGWVGTSLSGTLFFPSLNIEVNPLFTFANRIEKGISYKVEKNTIISNQSTGDLNQIPDNSVDYIFTDPPFGGNLMYSELNNPIESWLRVQTNSNTEAIMNKTQGKNLNEYQLLIERCFFEYFRILKPKRWITIEFSNSQASVWNVIQESIQRAGFVIANVAALDKKQGSFNAVTSTTAVKQDLVISAYKPSKYMVLDFDKSFNTIDSVWAFINGHLEQLPVFLGTKGKAEIITERTPRVLFDRMVAFHVQRGLPVPMSSSDFQNEVTQKYPYKDGMIFLQQQIAEYDKKRILFKEFSQISLFVSDENSAIEWVRQQLMNKPQTRQDLHPNFMREIQHIAKHELLPELDELLEQNFLMYDGKEDVPNQIHGYLSSNYKDLRNLEKSDPRLKGKGKNRWYVPDPNKQADLEKLREKSLLREFEGYKTEIEGNKKKLKQFRTEAIRTGFKKAWSEKEYEMIVKVGERLPEKIIQEDDKLLMYFDQAHNRIGM